MATDKAVMERRQRAARQLEGLAGEIRLQAHLGGMELRERWAAMEPRLRHALGTVGEVSEATVEALEELVERAKELARALRERAEAERTVGPRHQ